MGAPEVVSKNRDGYSHGLFLLGIATLKEVGTNCNERRMASQTS